LAARREKTMGMSKNAGCVIPSYNTRPRETRNYKLGRADQRSCKLNSIDRGGDNSYRIIEPYEDDDEINLNVPKIVQIH
jgi:hypothetical protein